MDVLGLLANISQVVDLLIKIGVMCSIYCVDVKNAPQDVRKLLKEVDRLTAVVKELESLLRSPKGASKLESQPLRQAVFDLRRLLAELVAKLDLGAKHARAVWPFRRRDVHDIVAAIERQKANILMNLNVEQTSILLDVHQEFVLSKLRVAEAASFDAIVDSEESHCLPGTRSDIIQQIKDWSTGPDSKSIFWLNGMAGTGKSTISRTVARSFSNDSILGASFFFKRGEADRGRTTFLFTTLAAQLVRRMPSLAPRIREVLESEPQIHEKTLSDQFQRLILDPLRQCSGSWQSPDLLIVVDALDECGLEKSMRTLINTLSQAQNTNNPRLKFFLTSRPELPIRLGFEDISGKYDNMLLAVVSTPTIEHDIELFMRHQLDRIKQDYNKSVTQHRRISDDWPGATVIQKLVASAIPLFIVAATICRFLNDRRLGGPPHQLRRSPGTLRSDISQDTIDACLPDAVKYACTYWVYHLTSSNRSICDNDETHKFLSIYLLNWLEALSLMGQSAESVYMVDDLLHKLERSKTQVIGKFLRDIRRFILASVVTLEKAPLQIYSSALIFAPERSIVRQMYKASIPTWLRTLPAMQLQWDACLATIANEFTTSANLIAVRGSNKFISFPIFGGEMKIWDLKSASCIATHNNVIPKSIRTSPSGTELLYITGREVLYVMEAVTRSCIGEYRGHTGIVTCAVFSADGQQFASASEDGTLRIWDRSFDKSLAIYDYNEPVEILGFSPDGSMVLTISRRRIVRLLSSRMTRYELVVDDSKATVYQAYFSPNGQILAIQYDYSMSFLHLISGKSWQAYGVVPTINLHSSFFSEGTRVIAPMRRDADENYAIGIWNISTATATCDALLKGHRASISDIILSADESRIASSSQDKTIRVWDTRKMSCIAIYEGHAEGVFSLAYSADETLLVSVDTADTLKIWETNVETQESRLEKHEGAVLEVIFSSDKTRVITTSGDHTVRLWDAYSEKCVAKDGLYGWPMSVKVSPDGLMLLSSAYVFGTAVLKLWNIATGACQSLSQGDGDSVVSLGFSPAGDILTSTLRGGTLRYWDTATLKPLGSFCSNTYAVSQSVFLPDGTGLILGCDDGIHLLLKA
ncbi:hypothetical protein TgHK011_002479 [Trichoderma gracile]|nr:hypothetical protein TgHK011_002479 [Trichoderma gracile]